jgi:hypothetical protein
MSAPASTCTGSPEEEEDDDDDKFPKPCRNMRIRVSAHASSLRRSSSAVMAVADLTNSRKHKTKSGSGSPCRTKNARLLMNEWICSSFRSTSTTMCLNGMKPGAPPSTYTTSPNNARNHARSTIQRLVRTHETCVTNPRGSKTAARSVGVSELRTPRTPNPLPSWCV